MKKIYCRYCGSSNIAFFKRIHQGELVKQFHYGIKCLDCNKSYKVERTKEIFLKVKDLEWEYSKNAKKIYFQKKRAVGVPAEIRSEKQ
jgi:hypothetical protein